MRLTDLAIQNAKPLAHQYTLWDETVKHFGLRISPGGTKTFTVIYGRTRERITVGRWPTISLAQARVRAKEILAERVLTGSRPPSMKFEEGVEKFFAAQRQKNKASTVAQYKRLFDRHLLTKVRHRKLADIEPHEISRLIDGLLSTPSECNHAFSAAQTFFRWAVSRRYLHRSPMEGMEKPAKYHPRERVLTDEEIRAVWKACEGYEPFGTIVRLLLLTGQRRSEIGKLRWSYIRGDAVTLPRTIVKNNRDHTFPLGAWAARILAETPRLGEYVFIARGLEKPFNGWQPYRLGTVNAGRPAWRRDQRA